MVNTIKAQELETEMRTNPDLQVVNVLGSEYAGLGLIFGSRRIPLSELDNRTGELNRTKEVVVYCSGPDCDASYRAAQKLQRQGFKVRRFLGGLKEWKQLGLPLEEAERKAA